MSTTHFSTIASRTQTARRIAAACGVGVLLIGTSACGSDPAPSGQSTSNESGAQTTPQAGQLGQRPGANGKIAAVVDSIAQVQSADSGQVAVTWNATTTFTKQVSAQLDDVAVGDCVMVTSESTEVGSVDQTTPPVQPTEVTATSVRISEATDGSCSPVGGQGGFPGGRPTGGPEGVQPPTGGQPPADGQRPTGGGQFRGMGGAFGTVTSVSATGFVVESTVPALDGTTAEPISVTVAVNAKTVYSTTAKGSVSDVKVGQCLRAEGETDDTGAVTATAIALTPPTDGECGGFSRRSTGSGNQGS